MYFKNNNVIELRIPASVVGKIYCIVDHYGTEVSWYGDITVNDDCSVITIDDIYLFPQVVTGGTFRTDTPQISEAYDVWYDEKLNEMMACFDETGESKPIMQYNGHSHVNMGVAPSGEDVNFRKSRNGINVYSIHSKDGKMSWEIWTDEIVYEQKDIKIVYMDDIFTKSKEYVQTVKQTPQTPITTAANKKSNKGYSYPYGYRGQGYY